MAQCGRACFNLFAELPAAGDAEQFFELLSRPGLRIERIVSTGQGSPPGFWYDQPGGEWVLVLQGEARLAFEDEPVARVLQAGDCVDIAPHRRHRVESTAAPTIWLAVHYDRSESPRDDRSESPRDDRSESPRDDRSESPRDDRRESPRDDRTESPRDD